MRVWKIGLNLKNQYNLMKKGDIFLVDLSSGFGHEQRGFRPAILVSSFIAGMVVVIPLTTKFESLRFPYTLSIIASSVNSLEQNSVALVFQIKSIDKNRLRKKVGFISASDLKKIDLQMRKMLGI